MTGEGTVDVSNKDLQANQRIVALESLWKEAATDPERLKAAREASKDVLWKSAAPEVLRERALDLLEALEGPAVTPVETPRANPPAWACSSAISASGGP